jgi:hypothetical protein
MRAVTHASKSVKGSLRSIERFPDTANGFPPCCLHFDDFWDFLAIPPENSSCFPRVDSASTHPAPVERVGKLVVRIRVGSSRKREGERERERGGGGREGELCGESVARMRMNSGGRVQHEMGGGGKAPSPEAETVTLL